ncbi:hypothetical protein [Streptosporangium sp. H16]|uniref:hypothetical protein n=1 Tax=Streptosporangium sp. H16 TaxID=3444184 RepID=UPI003F79D98B
MYIHTSAASGTAASVPDGHVSPVCGYRGTKAMSATAPGGPYDRAKPGAYTPRASASSTPISSHRCHDGPKGSGFTA